MTVPDAVHTRDDLDALLRSCTNYEKMPAFHQGRVRVDLTRMHAILAACDHPERAVPSVHITGSKGKGSTATLCAQILGTLGSVGLHTSPHLVRMEERLTVSGRAIDEAQLLARTNELLAVLRRISDPTAAIPYAGGFPTFFEYITLIGFLHFRASAVSFAVHEAGMGGRLDATNVLSPVACAITNVELEHVAVLGATTAAIAEEKGGIVKPTAALCTAEPRGTDARRVLDRIAAEVGVPVLALGEEIRVRRAEERGDGLVDGAARGASWGAAWEVATPSSRYPDLRPAILGHHQGANLALAVALAEQAAAATGRHLDPVAVAQAVHGMTLPGRLEQVAADPPVVLDGAHTAASARCALDAVREAWPDREVVVVLAMARDKGRAEVAALLAQTSFVVVSAYDNPRASPPDELLGFVRAAGGRGETAADPQKALARARELAEDKSVVLVMGSLYLVGAVRTLFPGGGSGPGNPP